MNGLSIFQKDNPQRSILKVGNPRLASDPPIRLSLFVFWMVDDVLDPLIRDSSPIRTPPCMPEVFGLRKARHQRSVSSAVVVDERGRHLWRVRFNGLFGVVVILCC